MKWEGNRESDNVEDRRDGGGDGFQMLGGRSIGIGTIVVALLGGWVLGINPLTILGLLSGGGAPPAQVQQAPAQRPPADDKMARFVSTVLADTEDVWQGVFRQADLRYRTGVASYLDVLDAQRALFATQQALAQSQLAQRQNQVALYKALGGGWRDTAATIAPAAPQN